MPPTSASDACEPCPREGRPCGRRIVLTGGPGAGKTAVLEIARKSFCRRVAFLPEAASIIFGGGFARRPSVAGRKAGQRAIFHVQREQERMVEEEAQEDGAGGSVLCDRGSLDGLAYWPESEESFFRDLGTTRELELGRYHAVIHLRTPGADGGYNHQNPLRTEDAITAHAIDQRIALAWEGHPNRVFIDTSPDFMEKALRAIACIKINLPGCCQRHPVQWGSST